MQRVETIGAIAANQGCSPAQLALAWVLAQGDDIVPIPGTKRRKYLEENIGALDVHLTPEELAEIDAMLPAGAAAGSRYSAPGMRTDQSVKVSGSGPGALVWRSAAFNRVRRHFAEAFEYRAWTSLLSATCSSLGGALRDRQTRF